MTKIPMYFQRRWYHPAGAMPRNPTYPHTYDEWAKEMVEMLTSYLNGEDVYVEVLNDPKRVGSIGKIRFTNVQEMLGNRLGYSSSKIEEVASNVSPKHFHNINPMGRLRWDGRSNYLTCWGSEIVWLKGYQGPTHWVYKKPEVVKVIPKDKLDREINVGDFISYILYHFGNSGNAAGIYYGKVTKIDDDGTVYAKNIKLSDGDVVAEKRIKDNSLIVIMTKDLMDKLMLARLSIL